MEICFNDITECINVSLSFPQNTIVAVVDNLVYEGLILSTEIGFAQLDQSLSTTVLCHFFLLHLERVCFIVQICLQEKVNYIVAPYELDAQRRCRFCSNGRLRSSGLWLQEGLRN